MKSYKKILFAFLFLGACNQHSVNHITKAKKEQIANGYIKKNQTNNSRDSKVRNLNNLIRFRLIHGYQDDQSWNKIKKGLNPQYKYECTDNFKDQLFTEIESIVNIKNLKDEDAKDEYVIDIGKDLINNSKLMMALSAFSLMPISGSSALASVFTGGIGLAILSLLTIPYYCIVDLNNTNKIIRTHLYFFL